MNIWDKIEEIRQKPEHIRMRYVWGMVAISMIFVISLWFLSILSQKTDTSSNAVPAADETMQAIGQSQQEIQDDVSGMKKSLEQIQSQSQNQNQIQGSPSQKQ